MTWLICFLVVALWLIYWYIEYGSDLLTGFSFKEVGWLALLLYLYCGWGIFCLIMFILSL